MSHKGKHRKHSHVLSESPPPLAVRPAEQILIDALEEIPDGRLLCTSLGRAQFAVAAAKVRLNTSVCCSFLDQYALRQATAAHRDAPANLQLECRADFPEGEFDVCALPTTAGGEAELVREHLQSAHIRLRLGGTLLVATDNPGDSWLHDEMRKLFAKVTVRRTDRATMYVAAKSDPLRKIKNYECRFAFRDGDRLIQIVSRPGVFSHRHVDGGARALMRAAVTRAGDQVLELGCGSGAVSLAIAMRSPDVRAYAVDSNVRAVECTRLGAELNGLTNLKAELNVVESLGDAELPAESCDLVVANPPYFSNHRIAEIFANCAARAIKPGGTVLFVTKRTTWYEERFPDLFATIAIEPAGNYQIVRAIGKGAHVPVADRSP